eukprot:704836-Hanusia_phi.AAC.1
MELRWCANMSEQGQEEKARKEQEGSSIGIAKCFDMCEIRAVSLTFYCHKAFRLSKPAVSLPRRSSLGRRRRLVQSLPPLRSQSRRRDASAATPRLRTSPGT